MGPQVIVSGHIPVEITKPYKIGLEYAVLEARFFFFLGGGVLNGMKGQKI